MASPESQHISPRTQFVAGLASTVVSAFGAVATLLAAPQAIEALVGGRGPATEHAPSGPLQVFVPLFVATVLLFFTFVGLFITLRVIIGAARLHHPAASAFFVTLALIALPGSAAFAASGSLFWVAAAMLTALCIIGAVISMFTDDLLYLVPVLMLGGMITGFAALMTLAFQDEPDVSPTTPPVASTSAK